MNLIVNRFVSLLLILFLLFNIIGNYIALKICQYKIRKEVLLNIKSGLSDNELTLIISDNKNQSEIKWIIENKEFRYKGELYDVVKIKSINNKKYYYCVCDKKEKYLLLKYERMKKNSGKTEKRFKKGINFQLFINEIINKNYLSEINIEFFQESEKIKNYYLIKPSPPPKF